ncbi:MAG: NAD(P)H-dependent glycerol-3-phosphate dehydrogenase [Rickettsiaceae bacterium]|nr:NAD(P)H-dependent glycerol-3-phosphate dehydrogenase [Rickettsiaceae bacterium]
MEKFAVIGGGSWGTALACHIASVSKEVILYLRDNKGVMEINKHRTNSKYLDDIKINNNVVATDKITDITEADVIVIAVPSHSFTETLDKIKAIISSDKILLIATKGLAKNPVELFSARVKRLLPDNQFAFISGPHFAKEVAMGKYTTAIISSENLQLAKALSNKLNTDNFEISNSSDYITTQVANIAKNIIAIKTGIMMAKGEGENAKASYIAKGLQEAWLIAQKLGGKPETILNPAITGDLILTSYSISSRNTKFGYEFYKNNYATEFLQNYPILVEGVEAAKLIKEIIELDKSKFPVITSVTDLIPASILHI